LDINFLVSAGIATNISDAEIIKEQYLSGTKSISEDEATSLKLEQLKVFKEQAREVFPELDSYSKNVQTAIVDLTYSGGKGFFQKFPKATKLIQEQNFSDAAIELGLGNDPGSDSTYKQVNGTRYTYNAALLSGDFSGLNSYELNQFKNFGFYNE